MEEFVGMLFLDVSELLGGSVPDQRSAASLEKPAMVIIGVSRRPLYLIGRAAKGSLD